MEMVLNWHRWILIIKGKDTWLIVKGWKLYPLKTWHCVEWACWSNTSKWGSTLTRHDRISYHLPQSECMAPLIHAWAEDHRTEMNYTSPKTRSWRLDGYGVDDGTEDGSRWWEAESMEFIIVVVWTYKWGNLCHTVNFICPAIHSHPHNIIWESLSPSL